MTQPKPGQVWIQIELVFYGFMLAAIGLYTGIKQDAVSVILLVAYVAAISVQIWFNARKWSATATLVSEGDEDGED